MTKSVIQNRKHFEHENVFQYINKKSRVKKIIDSIAHPFAAGTFYYFTQIYNQPNFHFISNSIQHVLGYEQKEFTPTKFLNILHPEDLDRLENKERLSLSFLQKEVSASAISSYKVAFLIRLKHARGNYITILHQARPTRVDENGKILETLFVHTNVSYLNATVDHKISLINRNDRSWFSLNTDKRQLLCDKNFANHFSERELEIIKCVEFGESTNEIAEKLFLSPHTIATHKKNILRKSKCHNFNELIAKCIRNGII